ncbi:MULTISPECIES: GTPase [Enterobacteriaceae]|uniref:GTPase n=1 Tax=Enterobacteriaceae TaxID=543 RepID=UPI0015DC6C54|nr:GTPase [Klebsiella sp. WP4-W18-ESBL-05]BBR57661.1 hypothetical protein WP4W18E05_10290 [Klebsiella sp. WP4-W18-ESBL-05]HAT3952312.1 hypothetical protein [Kluyvera ascorbata]
MVDSTQSLHTQLLHKADALLAQNMTAGKPVVVAWGLMNAGKSYLLNMLTDHLQTECFRTNDIRETAELKAFETPDFIFLDTPGLDANSNDDLIAGEGAAKADIVLFVHQPQGELEKIEIDFLREIKASFGQYAEQNIILVLSKSDVETPEKIEEIRQRMLEQCRDSLGFNPRCYALSGSRFHAGMTQKKEGLVRASHLGDLTKTLQTLNRDARAVKQERQRLAIENVLEEIASAQHAIRKQRLQTQKTIRIGLEPFDLAMNDFRNLMATQLSKFPAA